MYFHHESRHVEWERKKSQQDRRRVRGSLAQFVSRKSSPSLFSFSHHYLLYMIRSFFDYTTLIQLRDMTNTENSLASFAVFCRKSISAIGVGVDIVRGECYYRERGDRKEKSSFCTEVLKSTHQEFFVRIEIELDVMGNFVEGKTEFCVIIDSLLLTNIFRLKAWILKVINSLCVNQIYGESSWRPPVILAQVTL